MERNKVTIVCGFFWQTLPSSSFFCHLSWSFPKSGTALVFFSPCTYWGILLHTTVRDKQRHKISFTKCFSANQMQQWMFYLHDLKTLRYCWAYIYGSDWSSLRLTAVDCLNLGHWKAPVLSVFKTSQVGGLPLISIVRWANYLCIRPVVLVLCLADTESVLTDVLFMVTNLQTHRFKMENLSEKILHLRKVINWIHVFYIFMAQNQNSKFFIMMYMHFWNHTICDNHDHFVWRFNTPIWW